MTKRRTIAWVLWGSIAATASAQVAPATAACLARLPVTEFARVPVFVEFVALDTNGAKLITATDGLADSIAVQLRRIAGIRDTMLPASDSLMSWQDLDREVEVVAYRGGRVALRVGPAGLNDRGSGTRAADLLVRAYQRVNVGAATLAWPPGILVDSIPLVLRLFAPDVALDGSFSPITSRYAQTVFTLAVPWRKRAAAVSGKPPVYPPSARLNKVDASFSMTFVIDTTGAVDAESITDGWPAGVPRPTGISGGYADEFYAASKKAVSETIFTPSLIGGCKVREVVTLPIAFKIDKL